MKKIAAIILAAGKGKRMKAKTINKVVLPLGNKQMILHTVELLRKISINPIVVVVGFAKESVMRVLDDRIVFAEQKKRLGTAHAVMCALKKLPDGTKNALVLNGDDSAFYKEETIKQLIKKNIDGDADITFLTITASDPSGLGRVMRKSDGKATGIVEEKDATDEEKKIMEVSTGCYVFKTSFLKKYINRIKKSTVTGEYYLTSIIDIAVKDNCKVETFKAGNIPWRGINTVEELEEAGKLFLQSK